MKALDWAVVSMGSERCGKGEVVVRAGSRE